MNHRVLVTGLGVVSGLGHDRESFWQALLQSRSAIREWAPEGVSDFPVKFAAPVDPGHFEAHFADLPQLQGAMERRTRFGLAAAARALSDAGMGSGKGGNRIGVAMGSGVPERCPEDMLKALGPEGPSWARWYRQRHGFSPSHGHGNDHLSASIARVHGCEGPVMNLSTACAGAAHALGLGFRAIRRGEADCMLAGGADSVLNCMTMVGLGLLGAPSISEDHGDRLCRPFDLVRSGLVAAEGAGVVLLESEASAHRRGARVYAELCGFGSSMDAYRITAPHPEGHGAILAMRNALADAGMDPESIDYINAHGTSTPLNDKTETRAIKAVFARNEHFRRVLVSSTKSQIGHMIAAAGAPEFIATALALDTGEVPPTLNLETPDPECDLDYVPHVPRKAAPRAALSNSFGFGGLNACLALRRFQGWTA